ncbi:unnamed protein product, partial [Polarella glacialis]
VKQQRRKLYKYSEVIDFDTDCQDYVYVGVKSDLLGLYLEYGLGAGEDDLIRAAGKYKGKPHLRLNTNGLGSLLHGRDIVPELKSAGISAVSVALNAATAAKYRCIMRPMVASGGVSRVSEHEAFGSASGAWGPSSVEVTCVATPGLELAAVKELATERLAPGGSVFRERAFLLHEPVAAFAGDLGLLAADRAALGAADDLQNSAIIWAAEVHLDAKGMSGNTALHRAVKRHAACVHALLAAGADPAVIDGRGKSPAEDTADEAIAAELRKAEAVQAQVDDA